MIIYKYPLDERDNKVILPANAADAKVLCAQYQADRLMLWVQVPTSMGWNGTPVTRRFVIINTGEEFQGEYGMVYISTVQRGAIVSHVYEVRQ